MSRIGKRPVVIPEKVKVTLEGNDFRAEGPKGKAALTIGKHVLVTLENGEVVVRRDGETRDSRSMQGLTRTLLANAITGVSTGFTRVLEINGVGYRAEVKGSDLHLTLGLSHPVVFPLPAGVTAQVERQTLLTLASHDKQLIGEVAAKIRALRPPEPYKGKGIKYQEETIRRKQGKAGGA